MRTLTGLLPRISCKAKYDHLKNLNLGDPEFWNPRPVDTLLSAEPTAHIMLQGMKKGASNEPIAQNTKFGWYLSGPAEATSMSMASSCFSYHSSCSINETCLESTLQKFWEQEEPSNQKHPCTKDDEFVKEHFTSTVQRDDEGRFIVSLPFNKNQTMLGESYTKSFNKFLSLERELSKNPDLSSSYYTQVQDFIRSDWWEEVPSTAVEDPKSFVLPHHIITKLSSQTTKYRLVFDGSAKSSNGLSLNDCLLTGEKLKVDLFDLIINFRQYPIALSADIVKFYNQVKVDQKSSNFQRVILRQSPELPIKLYRINRVTFGVRSSPYLAIRCLHELANNIEVQDHRVSSILKSEFLVDNLLTGEATEADAISLISRISRILNSAYFNLRQWMSNSSKVMENIPENHKSQCHVSC